LVLKLRKARDRKRRETGRCEGNPLWLPAPDEAVRAAKRASSRGLSLREVSVQLAAEGLLSRSGRPYSASSVRLMLSR
jgi:hypothetical protein